MAPIRQIPSTAVRNPPIANHVHNLSASVGFDGMPPVPIPQSQTVTPADEHNYFDISTTQTQVPSRNITQIRRGSAPMDGNLPTDRGPSPFGPDGSTSGGIAKEDALKRNSSALHRVAICRRSSASGSVSFAEPMLPPSALRRLAVRDCLAAGNASYTGDEICANSWRATPHSRLPSVRTRRLSKKRSTRAVDSSQDAAVHAVPSPEMEIVGYDLLEADSQLSPLRANTSECSRYRNYCKMNGPLTSTAPQHQPSTPLISPIRKSGLEFSRSTMVETAVAPPRISSTCMLLDDCSDTIHDSSITGVPTTTSSVSIPNTVLSSTRIPISSTRLVNRDDLSMSAGSILGESSSRVAVDRSNCNDGSLNMSSSLNSTIHRNFSSETPDGSLTKSRNALTTVSASSSTLSGIPTKKKRVFGENPDRGRFFGGTAPISESSRRPTSVRRNPRVASASAMAALVAAVSFVEEAAAAAEATTAAAVQQPPQQHNFTVLVAEVSDDGYDALVADIWVGVVLTLMVLSCVCCVCSCLLYHKFQQWKRSVLAARNGPPREPAEGPYMPGDLESLPSYTIVSGLPSYEEALEQLRLARERRESLKSLGSQGGDSSPAAPATPVIPVLVPTSPPPQQNGLKLSVTEFFQMYKSYPPPV